MKGHMLVWAITAVATMTPDLTTGYIGVSAKVLVACAAGAYSSFSFGDKIEPRSRMFGVFISSLIMGSALTAIVNAAVEHFLKVQLLDGTQAGIGALVACLTRFFLPPVIDALRTGAWITWLPFFKRNNDKNGEQ